MKLYYVYIMASLRRVVYTGITSEFEKRIQEHKSKKYEGSFTATYNVDRLVYWEEFTDPRQAIAREKQIKGWRREKKIRLIEADNPDWIDLSVPPVLRSSQ